MTVYDLDKTQEWLNRTLAIGKEPPIRGGVKPDHKARRTTAASVGITLGVLVIGIWLGLALRFVPGQVMIAKESRSPATIAFSPAAPAASVQQSVNPPMRPSLVTSSFSARPPLDGFDLSVPNLDGGLRPLPGHAAPAAPVFLDGPSQAGMVR